MAWREVNDIDYVVGFAKNERLKAIIAAELQQGQEFYEKTKQAARVFKDFRYETRESWTWESRVVAKAEYLGKGANPRFVATSIDMQLLDARALCEQLYCGRGDMEVASKNKTCGSLRTGPAQARRGRISSGSISLQSITF